jgi:hypothetical protein
MRQKGRVSFHFKKTPPGTHFKAGTWSWIHEAEAERYEAEGFGCEWEPEVKSEKGEVKSEKVEGRSEKVERETVDVDLLPDAIEEAEEAED